MDHDPTERIEIRCECGAKITAPRSAVGRSTRCPKCRGPLVVTAPETAAHPANVPGAAGAPQAGAPNAPLIRLQCTCGVRLAVPPRVAGRKAKCPQCGQFVDVPTLEQAGRAALPSPTAAGEFDSLLTGLATGQAIAVGPAPQVAAPAQRASRGADFYDLAPLEPETPAGKETAPVQGESRVCPGCRKKFPANAVICVECGISLKTGRPVLMTADENVDRAYSYAEQVIRWFSWIDPLGIYPIASEAFGLRKPWVTRGIAALTILVSVWFMVVFIYPAEPSDPSRANLMLWCGQEAPRRAEVQQELQSQGLSEAEIDTALRSGELGIGRYHAYQLITHQLLHADPFHLAGNLLFLLVLGSRVNALIGNILTLVLYPLLGIAAALAQMAATAHEPLSATLGASGAIMGLAGMYLVLFPIHKVHMAFWFRWGLVGGFRLHLRTFAVRGFWVVLFYIAFDVVFTIVKFEDNVAHWAHLGGFLVGVGLALVLLGTRLVNARGGDLVTAVLGRYAWKLIGKPNDKRVSLW